MTGTDLCVNKPVTVPVIFEPPCSCILLVIIYNYTNRCPDTRTSMKSTAIHLLPIWAFVAYSRVNFTQVECVQEYRPDRNSGALRGDVTGGWRGLRNAEFHNL